MRPIKRQAHSYLHCAAAWSGAMALALGLTTRAGAQAACPDPIPLALTTVLTTDTALLGVQARNGLQQAVDDLNAGPGIAGKKIKLSVEDTGMSGAGALNALNRVLEDKPLIVYSSMISPHVFTQTEVVKKAELPFIVGATNGRITDQGTSWLFRHHVHDGQLAEMLPTYVVNTLKKTKPATLVVADDFGLGAQKGINATFEKLGVKTVANESYAPSDKDMTSQLLSIKDKGADVVVVFGRPAEVTIIMKKIKELGLTYLVIGNASVAAPTTLANLAADEADGAIAIGGMIPQVGADPAPKEWAAKMLAKFKVPADNFAVAYYDSLFLVKQVIEKVGCDKAAIRDELLATKDFKGMLISYVADKKGDLAHKAGIYRLKGKTPELIGIISESGF
jgi:branched-chain amino acid transport system substrate-binding protein